MVELSPFRTVVDLNGPALYGILTCGAMDATIQHANQLAPRCDSHNWSGGMYVINTIVSAAHFWVSNAVFQSPVGSRQANDVRPDITGPLTWPAGAFASRVQLQPSFPPFNGYAGRWVPLTTPEIDPQRHPGYKQGSSIELRYWGYSASGRTECVIPSLRPIVMESGRLSTISPPETRNDLTQYPGALSLTFGPLTVNERTFVPVGIWARYVAASDPTWLGLQRPVVSVLYQAHGS